ncbi:hypothetical protein A33M_2849 [Rhodovulum sp. PH10]|nr:hypothetical protein A33M_2849 [Rhodovulum sp. PH10]
MILETIRSDARRFHRTAGSDLSLSRAAGEQTLARLYGAPVKSVGDGVLRAFLPG